MQTSFQSYSVISQLRAKPVLQTHDSADEFSLSHWLEGTKLVEDAEIDEELAGCVEQSGVPRKPVSEVEPAAAYQHFARNIV